MMCFKYLTGIIAFLAPCLEAQDHPQFPARLKRADSFLGIHFDFHAGQDSKQIGANTTREMIESIIVR